MAADGASSVVLREDFETILGGTDLPPAPGPLELPSTSRARAAAGCATPNGTGGARSPRRPAVTNPSELNPLGAVLQTGIPMPLAHEAVAKHDVTLASLILAAYYRGIQAATGEREVLLSRCRPTGSTSSTPGS